MSDAEVLSRRFSSFSFTVLHLSQKEVTLLCQLCGNKKHFWKMNLFFFLFLLATEKCCMLAHLVGGGGTLAVCLRWKNAALLEERRSNGHLINLSCLNLLTTILPVTPFNSLMTLLSVRLRRTESKHDLIKAVHMFKALPMEEQRRPGSWDWRSWPRCCVSAPRHTVNN